MHPDHQNPPVFESEMEVTYSLEVVSELTGMPRQTILEYREQGLITAASDPTGTSRFNDETIRTLNRIEHLRTACEMNLAGLKLMLGLLDEVDNLRETLRARR